MLVNDREGSGKYRRMNLVLVYKYVVLEGFEDEERETEVCLGPCVWLSCARKVVKKGRKEGRRFAMEVVKMKMKEGRKEDLLWRL